MSTDQRLQQLSEQLGQTVNRIDQLQKKPTLTTRLGRHFRAQGSTILSVVLAGCVFSVATGRLIQKNEHAEEKQQWNIEKTRLLAQNASLQQKVEGTNALRAQIEQELKAGGWRLAPVAGRIHSIISSWGQEEPQMSTEASSLEAPDPDPQPPQVAARPKMMI